MHTIYARNVNEALGHGLSLLAGASTGRVRRVSPRGSDTVEFVGPVATVFQSPRERVLFSAVRDANPFFHFFESLWVLDGRDDVAFVSQFNKGIAQFADDGVRRHGAYGRRLRSMRVGEDDRGHSYRGMDQLKIAIEMLRADPDSRRVVLQIWDAVRDLGAHSKDIPCNDLIFLLVRQGVLDMTVCCRSNDLVWGTYGSNAVEFSVLQEYLAAMIGVGVGTYTQVSNSYHAYVLRPDWATLRQSYVVDDRYCGWGVEPYPIVSAPDTFDRELRRFLADPNGDLDEMRDPPFMFHNSFFGEVAYPLWKGWQRHKSDRDGWMSVQDCKASDWRTACLEWLQRRDDHP